MKIAENIDVGLLVKSFVAGAIVAIVFLYQNFATIRLVEEKYAQAIDHSDMNRKSSHEETEGVRSAVMPALDGIKKSLDRLEDRSWEQQRPTIIQAVPAPPNSNLVIKKE